MIEKLEQLTLSQFVDLVCGDTEVLLRKHEVADPDKLAIAMRNIVMEYRAITDQAGVNAYLHHIGTWIKARIGVIIFTMCLNLITLKEYDRAREVLTAYGLNADRWKEIRMEGEVNSRLERYKRELADIEKENEKAEAEREKIRSQFDTLTASLMAHFRFQIDPATIKATLYANLVAQHQREIKARLAAMKR